MFSLFATPTNWLALHVNHSLNVKLNNLYKCLDLFNNKQIKQIIKKEYLDVASIGGDDVSSGSGRTPVPDTGNWISSLAWNLYIFVWSAR